LGTVSAGGGGVTYKSLPVITAVPSAVAVLESLTAKGLAISIVTYMEAFQGIERSPAVEQAREKFQAFTDGVLILPFSFAVAERCARLRETLRTQKKRVNSRALDLIIAATALEYDLTLVTENTRTSPENPLSGTA
jgi:tRNA(fMet)-specific endonuclease VapC